MLIIIKNEPLIVVLLGGLGIKRINGCTLIPKSVILGWNATDWVLYIDFTNAKRMLQYAMYTYVCSNSIRLMRLDASKVRIARVESECFFSQ